MQQAPDFAERGALFRFATNAQHDQAFKSVGHLLAQQLHELYITVNEMNESATVLNLEPNHVFAVSAFTIRFYQSDVLKYAASIPVHGGKSRGEKNVSRIGSAGQIVVGFVHGAAAGDAATMEAGLREVVPKRTAKRFTDHESIETHVLSRAVAAPFIHDRVTPLP